MSTKSARSSGTQITQRGINQGNVLVDPVTGLPVDVIRDGAGIRRLAVDANLTADNITVDTRDLAPNTDTVSLGNLSNNGNTLLINSDGSIDVNAQLNAAQDNVAIADAISGNKLKVNADGSINVALSASSASNPVVYNITVPIANTEVSQALPAGTKIFSITVRNGMSKIQLAFSSGQSSTNYITIGRGAMYSQDGILTTSTTLYFQLDRAGQVVEILSWN